MRNFILRYLDRAGGRFGFDARYFAKNSFWLLLGQGVMSLSSLGATYMLANYVSEYDIGNYRLILSLYTVLVFFTMSGVAQAVMRSIVQKKDGAFVDAMNIKKKYGFLAFFIGTAMAVYFGVYRNNPTFGISIFFMSAALPVMEAFSMYLTYLQGRHEFKLSSLSQGSVRTLSALAVALVAFFMPSLVYLILAYYGVQAIATYVMYKVTLTRLPLRNKEKDPSMDSFGKHITLSGLPLMIFGQADKFILYHFFGPVALAQYWIASTIPQEVGRVLSTISQVAYPKFVEGDHSVLRTKLPRKVTYATLFLLAVSAAYALLAYPFFNVFFPQYLDQVPISIALMFAYAVIPYMFIWQYYAAQGNVKVVYLSNTIDPILQFFLYLIFIPTFGIWGLVYAMLIKTFCMNILSWYILKNH